MRIWVPKVKIIEPKKAITLRHTAQGFFGLRALNRYGQVKREHRQHNVITDLGLDEYGTASNYRARVAVGTGSASPATTDTALQTLLASTNSVYTGSVSTSGGSPYWIENTRSWRFSLGAVVGNLSEIGVGSTSTDLFARDLIRDGGGTPTTFPVASDEILEVAHTIRRNIPDADFTDTITVTGSGSHDITVRACHAQTTDSDVFWASTQHPYMLGTSGSTKPAAYETQTLSAATGTGPSGSVELASTVTNDSYVTGSFERTSSVVWSTAGGNFAGGIGSLVIPTGGSNSNYTEESWQVSFDPVIDKYAGSIERILTLNFHWSWARA